MTSESSFSPMYECNVAMGECSVDLPVAYVMRKELPQDLEDVLSAHICIGRIARATVRLGVGGQATVLRGMETLGHCCQTGSPTWSLTRATSSWHG